MPVVAEHPDTTGASRAASSPSVAQRPVEALRQVKPKLRGWLHAGMTPVIFFAGLVLCVFAPTLTGRIGSAIYLVAALLLFGTSATYHRGTWNDKTYAVFRRWDHANIYVFIAGSYTPLALLLLEGRSRVILLSLIWACAIAGVLFRTLWIDAPRWLYTLLYVAMGWAAVGWLTQFWAAGGAVTVILIAVGGLLYTGGAVCYGLKRPNPSPTWFGFHEVFHACTILAAIVHYIAIAWVIFS